MTRKQEEEEAMANNAPELQPRLLPHSRWSRVFRPLERKHIYATLLALVIIGGICAIAIPYYRANTEKIFDDDDLVPELRSASSHRKYRSPDDIGRMDVFIRKPTRDGGRRRSRPMPFPAARYDRGRLPFHGPFLSFMPSVPIFVDRRTRQTLIFSPSGIYILPPLINFYGKMFSVAELIASGYASLVSSGVPPVAPINMLPYFQPIPLRGPRIPRISRRTGGFVGGVETDYKYFKTSKHPRSYHHVDVSDESYEKDEYDEEERRYDDDRDEESSYSKHRYPKRKPKSHATKTATTTTTRARTTTRSPDTCQADCDHGCSKTCLRDRAKCDVKSETINIVTVTDQPPFISQTGDDEPVGLDVDLMNYIASATRLKFAYQYTAFAQLIPMVQNDTNLISISAQTDTVAREQFVKFVHFFKSGNGFFALSTFTGAFTGLESLCGKRVAVITSSTHEADAKNQTAGCASDNRATIVSVASAAERLNAVLTGAADVGIDDQAAIVNTVKQNNGQIKVIGEPYNVQPIGILCNKNNKKLCCTLVNAINYLIKKGTYENLLKKYSYTYAENGVCPSQINLDGSEKCLSECVPSDEECQTKLESTATAT